MAKLFGMSYTRDELARHMGDITQVGGVRLGELGDGAERGVRVADFRTGSGFDFTVHLDRGMDIGAAHYGDVPLAWRSPAPVLHPGLYEPAGLGWLRGFSGGLMTTCGLTSYGAPGVDEGQELGLHGRASYIPATHVAYGGDWHGNEYEMWVSGEVREAILFGDYLVLRRRISARLGESHLIIEDSVANEGYRSSPHMLLYHCNFGFPIVSADTRLLVNSQVQARDPKSGEGLPDHKRFQAPTAGYEEQVFNHTPHTGEDGYAQAALVNPSLHDGAGLGAYVRYRTAELPWLIQWKMMGLRDYVVGLEPGTNWTTGRAGERAAGRLSILEPGETRNYRVEIGVLASGADVNAFEAAL